MSILERLKPEIPQEEIENNDEIKAKYKYWRIRVFYSMYIGYALFYFTRKSFTFAMPALISDLGFDKADLGFLGSLLAITYGVSKFLSGVISDKSNLRYFMGLGLIFTGVLNIFFGLSSSIMFFAVFLGLNGLFQGWGSPPCAKLLTYWYSQTERGRWWGVWNTSHNIGGAIIPLLCAFSIQAFGWRYAMYLPGTMAIIVGLFLINRLRDNPRRVGLPSIEKFRNDYPDDKDRDEVDQDKNLSPKQILVEHIFKNKFIWILAISYFFVYIIRTAINDWIQLYLMEEKGYTLMLAGSCVFWFEIGGIFGSLAAGYLSDTIFKGKRGPVNVLFTLGIIGTLLALWFAPSASLMLVSTVMFFFGFLIFGPQMLIGMAAAELADKEAAGTATGFAGLFAYSGAACAGWPVGRITQDFGWPGFFLLLSICASVAVLLLLPLWSKRARPKLAAPANG
ncbi:MAG: MFS transporter family glucose-6-phosphate receptor UhpC [Chlamydiia bacterium]|nr:MFS transporter family glucose-6-phosphate receptor UhpC [Chlamydiia bacterium]